jgi:hypothetical protein
VIVSPSLIAAPNALASFCRTFEMNNFEYTERTVPSKQVPDMDERMERVRKSVSSFELETKTDQ